MTQVAGRLPGALTYIAEMTEQLATYHDEAVLVLEAPLRPDVLEGDRLERGAGALSATEPIRQLVNNAIVFDKEVGEAKSVPVEEAHLYRQLR